METSAVELLVASSSYAGSLGASSLTPDPVSPAHVPSDDHPTPPGLAGGHEHRSNPHTTRVVCEFSTSHAWKHRTTPVCTGPAHALCGPWSWNQHASHFGVSLLTQSPSISRLIPPARRHDKAKQTGHHQLHCPLTSLLMRAVTHVHQYALRPPR